jgi:hypothetical protein
MAQILEALKGHDELIDVIKYIVDQCDGNLVFEDNRAEGCISQLTVYSEHFTKKQLDVLFQYADYKEIVASKCKMKVHLSISI